MPSIQGIGSGEETLRLAQLHTVRTLHLLRPDWTGRRDHQARGQLFRGGHGQRRRYLRIYRGRRHRLWTGRKRPGQGREGHEADHGEVSGAQRCHPLQVAQGRGHGCRAARMSDVRFRRIRVFGGVAGEGGVSLRQRWGAVVPHSIGLPSPSSFPVGLCHSQQSQQAIGAAS